MISLAGVEGSPEHEVDVEWKEFLESYDQDGSILAAGGNNPTGFEEEYGEYLYYSQEMADKIEEICEKYGLQKLTGFTLQKNYEGLCKGAGVGDFLGDGAEDAKAGYIARWFFADGSFQVSTSALAAASITDCQISRHVKGTFGETTLNVGNIEKYRQWTYQTKCGVTVLLANNGTTKALILADLEKSFITVNVMGNLRINTFDVSDEQLEKMADAIDFSVIP